MAEETVQTQIQKLETCGPICNFKPHFCNLTCPLRTIVNIIIQYISLDCQHGKSIAKDLLKKWLLANSEASCLYIFMSLMNMDIRVKELIT